MNHSNVLFYSELSGEFVKRYCIAKFLLLGLILSVLVGCSEDQPEIESSSQEYGKIAWLVGTWGRKGGNGHLIEEWVLKDELMRGKGYRVSGADTILLEVLSIEKTINGYTYFADVMGQNEKRVIPFKSSKISDSIIEFYNSDHDFPNYIIYRRISNDSILVRIESSNRVDKREFGMSKL